MGLRRALERRAETVGPVHPRTAPPDFFSTGHDASGITVTVDNAQTHSAVYAAVKFLSETLAALSLKVYRRTGPSTREEARDHPLWNVLHDSANPEQTAFRWREQFVGFTALWGNGLTEVYRGPNGEVAELWNISPDITTIERTTAQKVFYEVRPREQDTVIFERDEILHCALGGALWGVSPIAWGRQSIGVGLAAQEYGGTLFGNAASPRGVLSISEKLGDDEFERLKESWHGAHSGRENWNKTAVLEGGATWQQVGMNPEDAQFIESRKFSVSEIGRWFGLPPHVVGDYERSTFSNVEQMTINLVVFHLTSWCRRIEQEMNHTLLVGPLEKATFFVEFDLKSLLRGDSAARAAFYQTLHQLSAINANEIRQAENMEPKDGLDNHYLQVNMARLDENGDLIPAVQAGAPPPAGGALRSMERRAFETRQEAGGDRRRAVSDSMRPLLQRAIQRVVNAEVDAIVAAMGAEFGPNGTRRFMDAIDQLYGEDGPMRALIAEEVGPAVGALASQVRAVSIDDVGTPQIEEDVDAFLDGIVAASVLRHALSSQRQVRDLVEKHALAAEEHITLRTEEWKQTRAEKGAHRESRLVENAVFLSALVATGVTRKRWRTVGANCPLCESFDGKVVGISRTFVKAGDTVNAPGRSPHPIRRDVGHPPLHRGCDCQIVSDGG